MDWKDGGRELWNQKFIWCLFHSLTKLDKTLSEGSWRTQKAIGEKKGKKGKDIYKQINLRNFEYNGKVRQHEINLQMKVYLHLMYHEKNRILSVFLQVDQKSVRKR